MQLIWIALATFASEDLALLAAGALVAQRRVGLAEATMAATAGIFAGDMLLFLAGRLAWRWRWLAGWIARRVSSDRLERATSWIEARGLTVVLLSRFTPGMRLPAFVAAGLLGGRAWAFTGYFLLAACLWTPFLVAGSALLGEQLLPRFGAAAFAAVAIAVLSTQLLSNFERRRRLVGFLRRKVRWEFWPAWAAYLPLVPYLLYLAAKHRSLTLFTAANPGIATGGFAGESKSQILAHLASKEPAAVAAFEMVDRHSAVPASFPVVLKPDAGERGKGVAIIRNASQWTAYLSSLSIAEQPVIRQEYVPGEEFGVFYVRFPHEECGRITSITEKRFPSVTGDGKQTLRELILNDERAVCLAGAYAAALGSRMEEVPAGGQDVQLIEIGSHCRGAVFLNASHLVSDALTSAVDRVAQAHPGFYIGRFDIRAASVRDLQNGDFKVIELNGVSAEPAHIYDPSVSLLDAYCTMMWQWRSAFEIGAVNRAAGVSPMTVRDLVGALRARPA